MPSPTRLDPRSPGSLRPDGRRLIDHGIEQVVHLPADAGQRTELYQGADLSPASKGNAEWLAGLYPDNGIDAFLAASLDLPIEGHLLRAPVFNSLLDQVMTDLESLHGAGHPAGLQISAALDVLRSQADLRDLLTRYRNALLEA